MYLPWFIQAVGWVVTSDPLILCNEAGAFMRFETAQGAVVMQASELVIAGWTGRDAAAVQHHVDELAALGVAPPSQVPLFYRVASALMTQGDTLTVLGADSSGEAEPLITAAAGQLWLGLGSDHTDRALEATSVAHSKQVCGKPVARDLWPLDSVADRLDALELRSWIDEGDGWVLYQEGTLAAIRPLPELIAGAALSDGGAMMCGTLPAIGGVRPASTFYAELKDPQTGDAITLEYAVQTLPVVA